MIRTLAIALLLAVPLFAQDAKKPPVNPGWQERLEKATKRGLTPGKGRS